MSVTIGCVIVCYCHANAATCLHCDVHNLHCWWVGWLVGFSQTTCSWMSRFCLQCRHLAWLDETCVVYDFDSFSRMKTW